MAELCVHLTFNGNCGQAMRFYHECLGGHLSVQTLEDSPHAAELPFDMQKYVVTSRLIRRGIRINGSDLVEDEGLSKGNSVSISLESTNEEELSFYYRCLSQECISSRPLTKNHWGQISGSITDKFGVHWLFISTSSENSL
ncbi:VOC family protein [Euzebyella marina]|nr:VOC family protein [Euzebyella marina]